MTETMTLKSAGRLEKILTSGKFALTAELGPPKSADPEIVKSRAECVKGVADAVNITDNQTAIVRMSSIAAGLIAKQAGLEPIVQITCRDRNRLAIQSDILGACALGVHNILCLSGDHQCLGNHPTSKNVFDMDSIQLIGMLKQMRDEKTFACGEAICNSKKDPGMAPRVFIGAAANPFGDPFASRVVRLAKKANAGVDFIQTQCVYDMERFIRWMEAVRQRGLHERLFILAGVTPLKSLGMARHMRNNVAGIIMPDEIFTRMEQAKDPKEEGINICVEQIQQLKEMPGVAGIHLMAINWEHMVPEIANRAGLTPRPEVLD